MRTQNLIFMQSRQLLLVGSQILFKKLVKITVANCLESNCQVCSSSSTSICTAWNSGYNLNSGVWNIVIPQAIVQKSEVLASTTSQSLGTTLSGIVGSTFVIVTITSLMNSTTMASVWSMINQVQMFVARIIYPHTPGKWVYKLEIFDKFFPKVFPLPL